MPKVKKLERAPMLHKTKQKLNFFSLPGEIRNKIYEHFYNGNVVILGSKQTSIIANMSMPSRQSIYAQMLEHEQLLAATANAESTPRTSGSQLHRASKRICAEVLPLLYASKTFSTFSSNHLLRFIKTTPTSSLKFVTSLQLSDQSYAPPRNIEDNRWKLKHQKKWELTCVRAAKALPSLSKLHIILDIHDVPLKFRLYERWVLPLYTFSVHCTKLADVVVVLATPELDRCFFDPKDTKKWVKRYYLWHIQGVKARYDTCKKLHRLFGDAIAKKMLGMSDEDAMEGYVAALEDVEIEDFVFTRS